MIQQELHYQHSGGIKLILDGRDQPDPNVPIKDCYFLGFRLSCQGEIRYHHTWIIANDHEAFKVALEAATDYLPDSLSNIKIDEFDLVFVHSLRTRSPDFLTKEIKKEASVNIGKALCQRDDEHFAVFGVSDDQTGKVLDFRVKDALMAIRMTRSHSQRLCGKSLQPLIVCQAHPVTPEFDVIFNREAVLVTALICNEAAAGVH